MRYKILSAIVLFVISNNAFPQNPTGTLTDTRDGLVYKTVNTSEQRLLTENLNSITANQNEIVTEGLVAYFPFSGNANDLSGNNNNGTVNGATLASDRFGNPSNAFQFDGVEDFIEIEHSSTFNITEQISISFWAKLESSAPYYYPYHIIEKYECWGFGQREDDVHWGVTTSNGNFNVWALSLNYNQWYHFVVNYDGSNINIYVNGQFYASEQASGSINTNTNEVYISRYNEGGDYYFDGTLDDFRIYNRALNQSEILELFHENEWNYQSTSTVTDTDGNVYKTIKIGNQWWMAENLDIGIRIDGIMDQTNNDLIEKYCYDNNKNYCDTFGGLYQFNEMMQYEAFENSQGICPTGWHIPSDNEWTELSDYLGGKNVAGGAMKEVGFTHWDSPNTGANNKSGFTALPGGLLYPAEYYFLGQGSYFWSSTKNETDKAYFRGIGFNSQVISREGKFLNSAFSVRCIKDNELQTPNSWLGIYNIIPNNSTFPGCLSLWEDSTNINITEPIKICADGSKATKFEFVNNNPSVNSNDIRFVTESNQTLEDLDRNGYFTDYEVSGNKVTAYFNHPQYVEGTYLPFRHDEIEIIDSNNPDIALFNIPVSIYRAPVVMIHGLWGEPSAFDDLYDTLEGGRYYDEILLKKADYTASNDLSFKSNEYEVYAAINETFDTLRHLKYSAGKVDIIAHSMGGILARTYLQAEYYRNDIHKLITLNTPHSGTQMANFLLQPVPQIIVLAKTISIIMNIGKGFHPYSYKKGAVHDLQYNSPAMLYNFVDIEINTKLNNNVVPTHVITTTGFCEEEICSKIENLLEKPSKLVFNETENDGIVPISSQIGGLNVFSNFENQFHVGVSKNVNVQEKILDLVSQNPNDPTYFSKNGFHPPLLNSLLYKSSKIAIDSTESIDLFKPSILEVRSSSITGQVEILEPSSGSIFHSGENINIGVESTGQVNRLALLPLFDCSGCSDENPLDTFATNVIFNYNIPEEIVGERLIMALGFDSTELIAYDTISINVIPNAILDSIGFYEESMILSVGRSKSLKVFGYYNDGKVRDISTSSNITFVSEEQEIAKNLYSNFIEGINEGNTIVHVIYEDKTKQIHVKVLQGDTIAIPSVMTPPDNISASDGIFTNKIEISWDKIGEACYYQVYRNTSNDTIGASIITNWDIDNFYIDTSIVSNEMFYYWIKSSTSMHGSNETEFSLPDSGYAELECNAPLVPEEITGETNPFIDSVYSYEISPIGEAENFDWYTSGGIVTGNDTIVSVTWTNLGIQTLSVKAINDCGESDSTTLDVNVINYVTGIENNATNSITVYPNPFKEEISIVLDNSDKIQNIKVYNTIGIKVKEVNNVHLTETYLNMADIEKGMYCLIVSTEKGIYYKNIVKF